MVYIELRFTLVVYCSNLYARRLLLAFHLCTVPDRPFHNFIVTEKEIYIRNFFFKKKRDIQLEFLKFFFQFYHLIFY